MFLGGEATVESYIEQQQYELIASLERSFQELLASNSALCARFNRLEQLVLQHRYAFAHREVEHQPRSSSAVPGSSVTHCFGFGSRRQAYTSRFDVDDGDVDEMLPKSSCTQWRNEEMRMNQAEKNVFNTDGSIVSETEDTSSSSVVNSQQDRWLNVADFSDVDAWPNTRRQYAFYDSLITLGLMPDVLKSVHKKLISSIRSLVSFSLTCRGDVSRAPILRLN